MSWIWPILGMLVVVVWTFALVDIVRRRHTMSGVGIVAWVIVIFVFPILGTIVYFLVHGFSGPPGAPRDPEVGGRLPDA